MDYMYELNHEDSKHYKNIRNCIYQFISPSGKSYIGKAKNFHYRYNNHKQTALNENRTNKTSFYDSFKKYNFFDYNIRILVENLEDGELLNFAEELFIEKYKTQDSDYGYNMTKGGDGTALFGEYNGMYGKKHTEEAKQKMRDNAFRAVGELNGWHKSNRTKEELAERSRKRTESYFLNISKMSEEEKQKAFEFKSAKAKDAWKNIETNPNLQNSLNALRYWEYKTEEELQLIDSKKSCPGVKNGRAKIFILESPGGEKFEVCLDEGLREFCETHNLVYRALQVAVNKDIVEYPKKGDSKFHSDETYKYKRLNTIGWKINSYRRKDYEVDV